MAARRLRTSHLGDVEHRGTEQAIRALGFGKQPGANYRNGLRRVLAAVVVGFRQGVSHSRIRAVDFLVAQGDVRQVACGSTDRRWNGRSG